MRTGITNLPLHYGSAPAWLFGRMKDLSREITIAIIREYGAEEMLKRLADPYWFQAFGCVLGFDWHSSGLTTTLTGALKEGLRDIEKELGFYVCGGKGKTSRKTPLEIEKKAINSSSHHLVYASKMSAKVDNTALQDGYQLYHHAFFFTPKGKWAVVQQGMNSAENGWLASRSPQGKGWARRYHWLSDEVKDFVCEPEKVADDYQVETLNLVAEESGQNRRASAYVSRKAPEKVINKLKKFKFYHLPKHHQIFVKDLQPESLFKILFKTYQIQPENFEQLLAIKGVGPKTIRALSLISELIFDAPACCRDPVKYSFAHGGKDGIPYPVDRENYDQSISILKSALESAKIENREKIKALKNLALFY